MTIKWEVEDGYTGGSRPQSLFVCRHDLREMGDTVEELMKGIEELVQEDFEEKVTWSIRQRDQLEVELQALLDEKLAEGEEGL